MKFNLRLHTSVRASESASIQAWHWYSTDQAKAAALFVRRCGALEATPLVPSPDEASRGLTTTEQAQTEHRSYVLAAVLASVAFPEAAVNELCASAAA